MQWIPNVEDPEKYIKYFLEGCSEPYNPDVDFITINGSIPSQAKIKTKEEKRPLTIISEPEQVKKQAEELVKESGGTKRKAHDDEEKSKKSAKIPKVSYASFADVYSHFDIE